jgi:hypothetical protein
LVPASAGAALLDRAIALSFGGAAQITCPALSVPVCDFVAEGAPIPVVQAQAAGLTLMPHKLAVISTLTGEMLRSSNAEELIGAVLRESCGPALDKALFSANPAAADRPAGLLNGIAGLTPSAAAGQSKSEILVDDLHALGLAVKGVAGNGNLVLVASIDAAVALALRVPQGPQWPLLISSSLAAKTVILVALNGVVAATGGPPQIDASQEAELHYDSTPAEIVTSAGTVAHPVGSLYQTDSVALRLRWPITWALRSANALSWMSGINW